MNNAGIFAAPKPRMKAIEKQACGKEQGQGSFQVRVRVHIKEGNGYCSWCYSWWCLARVRVTCRSNSLLKTVKTLIDRVSLGSMKMGYRQKYVKEYPNPAVNPIDLR